MMRTPAELFSYHTTSIYSFDNFLLYDCSDVHNEGLKLWSSLLLHPH